MGVSEIRGALLGPYDKGIPLVGVSIRGALFSDTPNMFKWEYFILAGWGAGVNPTSESKTLASEPNIIEPAKPKTPKSLQPKTLNPDIAWKPF